MNRLIACFIALMVGLTRLPAQQTAPTFRIRLAPTITTLTGNLTEVSYRLQFFSIASDSLNEVAVLSTVPVSHVLAPTIPARLAYLGTHEGELLVAKWAWLGKHPHDGATATLSYQAAGIPGIVTYRAMRDVPPHEAGPGEIDDDNPPSSNFTATDSNQVVGRTVGVVPPPSDTSVGGLATWLRGQATQACALGWIDNAGICKSIVTKLDHGSFAALQNELHAQRGKHLSEEGYALLSTTVARLQRRTAPGVGGQVR